MMKINWKYLLIIVVFIVTSYYSFASTFTLRNAVEIYRSFLKDYESENSKIELINNLKSELKNLAIYRLIKLEIAGSIERKESASSIFDYLTAFYNKNKPQTIEERIALAGLLSYVVARLSDENLKAVTINNLPAFISAFNDYVLFLTRDFKDISKNVIIYSLGLTDKAPKGFENIPVIGDLKINGDTSSLILKNKEYVFYTDVLDIFKETDISDLITYKTKEIIVSNPKNLKELNRMINIASNSLSRNLRVILSSYQLATAKDMVAVTPKNLNLWWSRFLIYIVLIIVFLLYFKKSLNFVIYMIVGFESFYIVVFSKGFFDKFDSVIYSLLVLVFIFGLFRFMMLLTQRKLSLLTSIIGILLMVVYISIFFIPVYPNSNGLKISNFNNFEDSVYYKLLKRDLYLDSNSNLNRELSNVYSITSKEYSELKNQVKRFERFMNDLHNLGAISKISVKGSKLKISTYGFSDFYSFKNWERYNSLFSEIDKGIKDFKWESQARKKQISRLIDRIFDKIEKYSAVFTKKMREDFFNYLREFLSKSNTTKFMLADIENIYEKFSDEPPKPIKIQTYKTRTGNVTITLGLITGILMFFSKRFYYKIVSAFLLVNTVLWIFRINSAKIFVDKNIPILSIDNLSNPNLFIPIMFLMLAILFLLNRKTLKEG